MGEKNRVKFSDRNQKEFQDRIQTVMREKGVDGLILTEFGAIYYATGHYSTFQKVTNVPGYCIAVCPAEGEFTVIMPDYETMSLDQVPGCSIDVSTTGIFIDGLEKITGKPAPKVRPSTVDGSRTFRQALDIIKAKKPDAVIGIQSKLLTHDAVKIFQENAGSCTYVDCDEVLSRARMIKTKWEIEVLRTAAQMSERQMNATANAMKEGMTVGTLVNLAYQNCFAEGEGITGARPVLSVGGRYFGNFEIPPEDTLRKGDIVRMDCGPFYLGYISDICRAYSVGKASDEAKRIYAALMDGYRRELEMVGPGVKIADVYNEVMAIVRKTVPDYVRGHLGHSIGTYFLAEEYPYISPYVGEETFQPGMVVSCEVPYSSAVLGGMTPEDSVVITENGYDRFTYVPEEIVEIDA